MGCEKNGNGNGSWFQCLVCLLQSLAQNRKPQLQPLLDRCHQRSSGDARCLHRQPSLRFHKPSSSFVRLLWLRRSFMHCVHFFFQRSFEERRQLEGELALTEH